MEVALSWIIKSSIVKILAVIGEWIPCRICACLSCPIEVIAAWCDGLSILGQACHRAWLVGQVVVAVTCLVVEVASSTLTIAIGLTSLAIMVIGFEDFCMFTIDIVDIVAFLVVVVGVLSCGIRDQDILNLTGIGHFSLTR